MEQDKKLRYRIAVRYESNHFVEAHSSEEAIRMWQKEMNLDHISYKVKEQEWIKGGFRLVLELQEHLSQTDRDTLAKSISIGDIDKSGERIR